MIPRRMSLVVVAVLAGSAHSQPSPGGIAPGSYLGYSSLGGFGGYRSGYMPYWYGATSGYATYPGYYGFSPGTNWVYGGSYHASPAPAYIPYSGIYGLTPPVGTSGGPAAYSASGAGAPAVAPSVATVTVRLPDPAAELFVEGVPTLQTGTERKFVSPPLPAGAEFRYTLRARFRSAGREVEETRTAAVRAGGLVTVEFTSR